MNMRLVDLDPEWVTYERRDNRVFYHHVDSIDKAQGIIFMCPKCFEANGGPRGTHRIVCWSRSRGVPDLAEPGPGRWMLSGSGFHDLTLDADLPNTARSVALHGGCNWHGYVTKGEATTL